MGVQDFTGPIVLEPSLSGLDSRVSRLVTSIQRSSSSRRSIWSKSQSNLHFSLQHKSALAFVFTL